MKQIYHLLEKQWSKIATQENLYALALALILLGLVIFTADSAPTWIYQGF